MKNLYPTLLLLLVSAFPCISNAQSVSLPQASLSETPMGTLENGGNAIGGLNFIETSGADVPSTAFGEPNVTISIDFSYVELSEADINQITGSLLDYFTATYDVASNILLFKQKNIIPGDWKGAVEFPIDVTQNSTQAQSFNGFNANIAAIGPNTNAEGNASIFTYTDASVLSVDTNNGLTYNVYPNPTQEILQVNIENNFATKAEIFDLSGKLVLMENYDGNLNNLNLNISHLAPAVYVLKISSNDATSSIRIIKE